MENKETASRGTDFVAHVESMIPEESRFFLRNICDAMGEVRETGHNPRESLSSFMSHRIVARDMDMILTLQRMPAEKVELSEILVSLARGVAKLGFTGIPDALPVSEEHPRFPYMLQGSVYARQLCEGAQEEGEEPPGGLDSRTRVLARSVAYDSTEPPATLSALVGLLLLAAEPSPEHSP